MNHCAFDIKIGRILSLWVLLFSVRAFGAQDCADLFKPWDLERAFQSQSQGDVWAESSLRQISPGLFQTAKVLELGEQGFKYEALAYAKVEEGEAEHEQFAKFLLKPWAFATQTLEVDLNTESYQKEFSPYTLAKPVKVKREAKLRGEVISLEQVYQVETVNWKALRFTLFSKEARGNKVFSTRLNLEDKRSVEVEIKPEGSANRLRGKYQLPKVEPGVIVDTTLSSRLLKVFTSEGQELHYKVRPGRTDDGEYGLVFVRLENYQLSREDFDSLFQATLVFETR